MGGGGGGSGQRCKIWKNPDNMAAGLIGHRQEVNPLTDSITVREKSGSATLFRRTLLRRFFSREYVTAILFQRFRRFFADDSARVRLVRRFWSRASAVGGSNPENLLRRLYVYRGDFALVILLRRFCRSDSSRGDYFPAICPSDSAPAISPR